MIKTTLPIIEKTLVKETTPDGEKEQIKITERDIVITLDTSVYAEERWEQNFPHNAEKETLFAYVARVQKSKQDKATDTANVLSNLKAIYCFIESDEVATFKEFCRLFDLSDARHTEKVVNKIVYIFELVSEGGTASPKNS